MRTCWWPTSATHNSVTSVGNTADCAVSNTGVDGCDGPDDQAGSNGSVVVTVVVVVADFISNSVESDC